MRKIVSPHELYLAQKQLTDSIKSIPKKNKRKFSVDLIKLISLAHEDNYENFEITEN